MPLLYKLDYDPVKAFVPVASLVVDKSVMVAGPSWPVKTVQELVAQAKAKPGQAQLRLRHRHRPALRRSSCSRCKAGVDIVHVPYRGGAPMITDLIGGQIHVTINGKSVLLPAHRGRQGARAGGDRRHALGRHAGRADADGGRLPRRALRHAVRGRGAGRRAGGDRRAAQRRRSTTACARRRCAPGLEKLGIEPYPTTPAEFAKLVAEEAPRWGEAVRLTGIKVQ